MSETIEKARQTISQDGVAIISRQSNIASTLKKEMAELMVELRIFQVLFGDAVKHEHPHATPDIRTDQMRQDGSFHIGNDANGHRFARMEIRRRHNRLDRRIVFRESIGRRKGAGKVQKRMRKMSFRFVARND